MASGCRTSPAKPLTPGTMPSEAVVREDALVVRDGVDTELELERYSRYWGRVGSRGRRSDEPPAVPAFFLFRYLWGFALQGQPRGSHACQGASSA